MAIREDKITVRIKDFVDGREGTFLKWKDATHKMPSGSNEKGYRMYYYPDKEGTNSIIVKLSAMIAKTIFSVSEDKAKAFTDIQLTRKVYPKSGIKGFNGGTTFENPDNVDDTPDKFVVLLEDRDGKSHFMDEHGPTSENYLKKYREMKEKKENLEQQLEGQDVEMKELEDKVGDDEDNDNRRQDPYGLPSDMMSDDVMRGEP
jgi:hypothetical protein